MERKEITLRMPYKLYESYVKLAEEYGVTLHEMLIVGLNHFKNETSQNFEYKA